MGIEIIRNDEQYESALSQVEELVLLDPSEGTPERNKLEILALLIDEYEKRVHNVALPDPVDAIKFRMDQQGLKQRDLVQFLGSRSRVSEVLNRKRGLSLSMIRALHKGLGIPAKVLLQDEDPSLLEISDIEWEAFPLREMAARQWVEATPEEIEEEPEYVMSNFLKPIGKLALAAAFYRKTQSLRSARTMDRYALAAWTIRVAAKAIADAPVDRGHDTIDTDFMKELVHLSLAENGPKLAAEALHARGLSLVIEEQLPGTYLDGAAILTETGRPVVALTLRYDRVDNFWFTLMHELAHVVRHLGGEQAGFYDDLDFKDPLDDREKEADDLAREVLIPEAEWRRSSASRLNAPEAALNLAGKLEIHPAIVAGRMRHDRENYRILSNLIGHGEVRKLFDQGRWKD